MERFVGSGVTIQKTLTKVGLDQFGFSPIFTSGILTMIGLFQGQTLGSIKTKLDNELLDIVVNGWKVRILFTNPLCSRNFQNVKLRSSYTRIYLPLNFGWSQFRQNLMIKNSHFYNFRHSQLWILVNFELEKWLKFTKIKIQNL